MIRAPARPCCTLLRNKLVQSDVPTAYLGDSDFAVGPFGRVLTALLSAPHAAVKLGSDRTRRTLSLALVLRLAAHIFRPGGDAYTSPLPSVRRRRLASFTNSDLGTIERDRPTGWRNISTVDRACCSMASPTPRRGLGEARDGPGVVRPATCPATLTQNRTV
jgi:hypothetical protein